MAELKTKETNESVTAFLNQIADARRRADCRTVIKIMKAVTKAKPRMWGSSIVGFGRYRYKYASGREGDWTLTGFSPRKRDLTLYIMNGFGNFPDLMKRLGKYRTSKSCLYIRKLDDVDLDVLKELITRSVEKMVAMSRNVSPK